MATRRKTRVLARILLICGPVAALVALVATGISTVQSPAVAAAKNPQSAQIARAHHQMQAPRAASEKKTPGPEVVRVGIYYNRVLGIHPSENSYDVDFFLWFNWKGSLDASSTLDLLNSIGNPAKRDPFYPVPQKQPDGSNYQGWHIQATFDSPMDFRDYPADEQTLPITIEDNQSDATLLQYQVGDVGASDSFSELTDGWQMKSLPTAKVSEDAYNTSFGLGSANSTYSQISFSFQVGRNVAAYWTKALLGVLIIVGIAMLVFFLDPHHVEARVLAAITALISAVLLHDATAQQLPFITYFERVDWIYLLTYVVIFVAMIETVVSVHLDGKGKNRLARKIDHITAAGVGVVFVVGILMTIL